MTAHRNMSNVRLASEVTGCEPGEYSVEAVWLYRNGYRPISYAHNLVALCTCLGWCPSQPAKGHHEIEQAKLGCINVMKTSRSTYVLLRAMTYNN